jgi:hypothetical protein
MIFWDNIHPLTCQNVRDDVWSSVVSLSDLLRLIPCGILMAFVRFNVGLRCCLVYLNQVQWGRNKSSCWRVCNYATSNLLKPRQDLGTRWWECIFPVRPHIFPVNPSQWKLICFFCRCCSESTLGRKDPSRPVHKFVNIHLNKYTTESRWTFTLTFETTNPS